MGTRRSKHNKGRKPLYKEFRLISAGDTPWWHDDGWTRPVEASPVPLRRYKPPTPNVQLEARVAAFLAQRQAVPDNIPIPSTRRDPERVPEVINIDADHRVSSAPDDIILQMMIERRLTGRQFRAGRIWQFDMEAATIQPLRGFDWSRAQSMYQSRGDVTDRQFEAMRRRREFVDAYGPEPARFLDLCLDAFQTRGGLMRLFGLRACELHDHINRALTALCLHLGFHAMPDREEPRIRSWRAVA